MKTKRFSSKLIRLAAIPVACVLLVPELYATGGIRVGRLKIELDSPSIHWAAALTPRVKEVQNRFDASRRALQTVQGPGGQPAFQRRDVADLIALAGKDLDEAIMNVQPSDLQPLRDWASAEVARIQAALGALPGPRTAALRSGSFPPRTIALVASRGNAPRPAGSKPVPPPQDTVPAEKANSLLDDMGKVVSQIFTLASQDDLEVKLWVGSTAPSTTFSFWAQGQIKGSAPAPFSMRANGTRDHVIRGRYSYKAVWGQGAVAQWIQYPSSANAPAAEIPSEPLDLVKGTPFFCCQLQQGYCGHVDNKKECRP